jgi:hypothetical protein
MTTCVVNDISEIQRLAAEQIEEEQRIHAPAAQKFLVTPIAGQEDVAPIADWFSIVPPAPDYLFRDMILRNTVGQMNGVGGVSKSSLANLQAFSGATGRHIGPFKPPRPFRVFILNVEDPLEEQWRRFHSIGEVYGPSRDEMELLKQNLFVYPGRGRIGPLMELRDGNAVTTAFYDWLAESVKNVKPDFCILDTKSRLCGLPENSNENQSEFIRRLEALSELHGGITFQVVHHNRKAQDNLDSTASRGGQAQIDNSRFAIAVASLDEKDVKQFGIEEPHRYFKASLSKGNYTAMGSVWYFERGPSGVPIPVDLKETMIEAVAEEICSWLMSQGQTHTATDLTRGDAGKDLRKSLKEDFGAGREHIVMAIERAKSQDMLRERNEGRQGGGKGGKDRIVLVPVKSI